MPDRILVAWIVLAVICAVPALLSIAYAAMTWPDSAPIVASVLAAPVVWWAMGTAMVPRELRHRR